MYGGYIRDHDRQSEVQVAGQKGQRKLKQDDATLWNRSRASFFNLAFATVFSSWCVQCFNLTGRQLEIHN